MLKRIFILMVACATCIAAPENVERQAAQIRAVLHEADDAYYNRGEPIMADAAYDALREQYRQLHADYPELPAYDPIGAIIPEDAPSVAHAAPVLGLKKAYSDAEVEAFIVACGTNEHYCLAPKIDGLTVVLRYVDGALQRALTRGDGEEGMEVTPQIVASGCVPLALSNAPAMLEVRGEVFMSFAAFEAMNGRRAEVGQEPLKSPRNSAAGTLRMKDLAEVARRGLECFAFEIVSTEPQPETHMNGLAMLHGCGLPTVPSRAMPGDRVWAGIDELNAQRADLPYPTDGVVIRLDDRAAYERMGTTARWPNGALARKYKPDPVETTLLRVEWSQGETGKLTPIAYFEPVEVEGAVLQSATLHNLEHLRALDLMLGDRIQVVRAGGAVPEILGRVPAERTGEEQPIPDPE